MINSNNRKLCLSGWLQENHPTEFSSPLKLQKFLFLYEGFSKIDGDEYDFSYLKGYERGPVFSQVWGDYTIEKPEFYEVSLVAYDCHHTIVNIPRAERCAFITKVLSNEDLSELTHKTHIWSAQKDMILSKEPQVKLHEEDFNADDVAIFRQLEFMFPDELIARSHIEPINGYYFVFDKSQKDKITKEHKNILVNLTKEDLHNPVYVEIDNEGRLIVD